MSIPRQNRYKVEVNLIQLLVGLSRSLDFSSQGLMQHHMRIALMALQVGKAVGMKKRDLFELFKAAIVHDIGAVSWKEKAELSQFELLNPKSHCERGYSLLKELPSMHGVAETIYCHHDRWAGGNPSGYCKSRIPLASRIINLVDRIDVSVDAESYVLCQRQSVMEQIKARSGEIFDPDLVEVVYRLAQKESFWLDLVSPVLSENLLQEIPQEHFSSQQVHLVEIAGLFAGVVDAKSSFTYRHSYGVGVVARYLAEWMGMDPKECELVETAGLLHDLGKLAVPEEIIEKPGRLTEIEYDIIKQHTYYTYWLIKPIAGLSQLAEWAAFHHERLDGKGYPFRKKGKELELSARIIAVADIFVALRENRPYRQSLDRATIERIIMDKAAEGALDKSVVENLFVNFSVLDMIWRQLSEERLVVNLN